MRYLSVSPAVFQTHFDAARYHTRIAEATSPFEPSDGATYLLSEDWLSGFVVREDGELTNVWSVERGRGDEIVADAIERGAVYLDCFDGYLVGLYERHGFHNVKSVPNWTPGGPDVVYMALQGFFDRHGVSA